MRVFFRSVVALVCIATVHVVSAKADDIGPAALGPHGVATGDYKFPAKLDPDVSPTLPVELWARVWYPSDTNTGPHPFVLLLHGNHGTCGHYTPDSIGRVDDNTDYTQTGVCPQGYMVVPNHIGYSYLAENLASWGYIVVSINANRGITGADGTEDDPGLNMERGRLVLRHLELWTKWNRTGSGVPSSLGFNPRNLIDFTRVGLMGHSRGGEGVLAAFTQYNDVGSPWPQRIDPALRVRSILEFAPVDGQTNRVLYANNIQWAVLLPTCDGDVIQLKGQRVFDRTISALQETSPGFKSTFAVVGANHNFYNTEWQSSDQGFCADKPLFDPDAAGSPSQRTTGLYAFSAFFRATLGGKSDQVPASLKGLFHPSVPLPPLLSAITQVYRGYADSASTATELRFDDFDKATGTNTWGPANDAVNVKYTNAPVTQHEVQAAHVSWDKKTSPGTSYFESNWAPPGGGRDASGYATLEFRISPDCVVASVTGCYQSDPLNVAQKPNFSIALVDSQGRVSKPVTLSSYISLEQYGPARRFYPPYHATLPSVRIPFSAFGTFDRQRLRGVRFTFDKTVTGAVQVANLRLSTKGNPPGTPPSAAPNLSAADHALIALAQQQATAGGAAMARLASAAPPPAPAYGNDVVAIRRVTLANPRLGPSGVAVGAAKAPSAGDRVEIQLHSLRPIPVTDSLLTLNVGSSSFVVSRFVHGSTRDVVFTLVKSDFDRLKDHSPLQVTAGSDVRSFGSLSKAMLK